MLDIADGLLASLPSGDAVVVTVTRVARSAPRGVGASMAVTATGELIGSISGGCVESDAIALAHEVRSDGRARTARFGFSDDQAHAAGLACGGTVEVEAHLIGSGRLALHFCVPLSSASSPKNLFSHCALCSYTL